MGLRFRHYSKKQMPKGWVSAGYGFNVWGVNRQPTLDICWNNHVFVIFWKRKHD